MDLISRQAALKALEFTWAGKAAFDAIKELPSAEPEQMKGSCSECQQIKDLCVACKRNVNFKDYFIRGKEE